MSSTRLLSRSDSGDGAHLHSRGHLVSLPISNLYFFAEYAQAATSRLPLYTYTRHPFYTFTTSVQSGIPAANQSKFPEVWSPES